jgi:hypothetical protein
MRWVSALCTQPHLFCIKSLATLQTNGSGTIPESTVTIPSTVAAGTYALTATGGTSGLDATGTVIVLAPRWYVAGTVNSSSAAATFVLRNTEAQAALVQIVFYSLWRSVDRDRLLSSGEKGQRIAQAWNTLAPFPAGVLTR